VLHQKATEWSGGRRRGLLEFNANGHVVIGVDLNGTQIVGAIADLGGKILHEVALPRPQRSGEENYDRLVEVIESLLHSPELTERRLHGIGVGAPGVTLHREGIVTWAASLDWRAYPLKAKLTERFNLPVMVDNDLNLAALGEYWFGAGQNTQTMILVVAGVGLGSGIILNGALYRGAHEASGEVGDMIPGREFLAHWKVWYRGRALSSGRGLCSRINVQRRRSQTSRPMAYSWQRNAAKCGRVPSSTRRLIISP